MRKTFELLRLLEDRVHPEPCRTHSLNLAEDGKSLVLSISANRGWFRFTLDESDFDKALDVLLEEVLELFREAVKEQATAKPAG